MAIRLCASGTVRRSGDRAIVSTRAGNLVASAETRDNVGRSFKFEGMKILRRELNMAGEGTKGT